MVNNIKNFCRNLFNCRSVVCAFVVFFIFLSSAFCRAELVSEVNIKGLVAIEEERVRDVIDIKQGDEFSLEAVELSIARLRMWGVFDAISVDPLMTDNGIAINYNLDEALIVSSIDIEGNYPYVETKVRKYLTLHPGDIYTPTVLEEQIGRIKDFYLRQGFVGTEIYVDEQRSETASEVALTFKIRHGDVLRYRKIESFGNHAFPNSRFASMLNTFKPFSEQRLRKSIAEIKELYHRSGYPRAKISLKSKNIDFDAHRVDVVFEINEGPHVKVDFTGPHVTPNHIIYKAITIFKEGSIDRYEIEASEEAIKELLHKRGYPDAKITSKQRELRNKDILILFNIDEGAPKNIRYLRIEGNDKVSDKELKAVMKNREAPIGRGGAYYPDEEQKDNEAIQNILKRKGFLGGTVNQWEIKPFDHGRALLVTVPIEEGTQTIVGAVEFAGNSSFGEKKLINILKMKPGEPLNEPALPSDRDLLVKFYADNGHPYADVKQSFRINEDGLAVIHYDISEGQLVRIGRILIVGDVLTSQKAIKHAMDIKEGQPFSYKKIVDSQLNIRRLGPFDLVSIETIGISEKQNIVHLKVKVEEQKPFLVDLGLAYSTDESLTGSLAFSNINAFGWAKTNSLKLTGGRKLSRAEVAWFDPRFLATSIEMATSGWIQYKQRPVYTYMQMAGAMGFAKRYSRLGFSGRYEVDRNYFVEGDSTAADADSLRDSTISRISLFGTYDTRDTFSEPSKGIFTGGGVDIYNEIKGKEANFVKFSVQFESDVKLFLRTVLSTALRFGRIQNIGVNDSVPSNELLFLGGNDTIRGFNEDSLGPVAADGHATGGRTRWIFNEELRIRIFKHVGLALFYDMGALENNFSQMGWNNTRKSAGVGLRYLTPVGPLRAEYGFKLDRKPGESVGHFHFTFGYVF